MSWLVSRSFWLSFRMLLDYLTDALDKREELNEPVKAFQSNVQLVVRMLS